MAKKEFSFEFKYVVKSKETDENGSVIIVDSIKWDSAKKKIVSVEIENIKKFEDKNSIAHFAKTKAREKIVNILNEEHGTNYWRFFD